METDVQVSRMDDPGSGTWNRVLAQSAESSLFHRFEVLSVLAEHSGAELHPLVGRRDGDVVGLLPIFELRKGPFTTAFAPPPDLRVPYLGPVVLPDEGVDRYERECLNRSFVDGCFSWIDAVLSAQYVHLRFKGADNDLWPFQRNDYDATPSYTYHTDLDRDEDELVMSFSSDARTNIQRTDAEEYVVEEGGPDAIDRIIDQVSARYAAQDIGYHVTGAFVRDLYHRLPDGRVRPYEIRTGGEFVGGVLALEDDDTVYRWQGGVRTEGEWDLPVNDLLDWHVMTEARLRGRRVYDLVGADKPSINRYKAKFNPELVPFYSVENGSVTTSILAHAYQRLTQRA